MNCVMRKITPLLVGAIAITAVSMGQASATIPVDPTLSSAASIHTPDVVQPVWWHHWGWHRWGWHRWHYWHHPWGWHRWGWGWHRWGWHRHWCYWHPRACGWW